MKLEEAKAECARWFAYLDKQREKAVAMQKIATEVRTKKIDENEARRRVRTLDNTGLTVYDGSNLEKAVKVLLQNIADRDKTLKR